MLTKTYFQIDYESRQHERISFDMHDAKGRTIGARVTFASGEFISNPNQVLRRAPKGSPKSGPAFLMNVHSTRNGFDFGPWQGWQAFATAADRDAAKAKYLDGARVRAAKRFGK